MRCEKPGVVAATYPGTLRASESTQFLSPEQCSKYLGCSAPICPFDPEMEQRVHKKGESICTYLRGHAKDPLRLKNQWGYTGKRHSTLTKVYLTPYNTTLKSLRADLVKVSKQNKVHHEMVA